MRLVVAVEGGHDHQRVAAAARRACGAAWPSAAGDVAAVDGVGQLPRRHAAGLAEERLHVAAVELGAAAVGRRERLEQRRQAADVLAQPSATTELGAGGRAARRTRPPARRASRCGPGGCRPAPVSTTVAPGLP